MAAQLIKMQREILIAKLEARDAELDAELEQQRVKFWGKEQKKSEGYIREWKAEITELTNRIKTYQIFLRTGKLDEFYGGQHYPPVRHDDLKKQIKLLKLSVDEIISVSATSNWAQYL